MFTARYGLTVDHSGTGERSVLAKGVTMGILR